MQRFVEVAGGKLNARSEGDGPPVVLVHAAIADLRSWDRMDPKLLAAGLRVIRYDMRGYGRSETERNAEFSHDVDLVAVLDAFGLQKAALVGNSLGGAVCFDAAVASPDRVVGVVGVGASLGGYHPDATPEEQAAFRVLAQLMTSPHLDRQKVVEMGLRIWVNGPGQSPHRVAEDIQAAATEMLHDNLDRDRPKGKTILPDPPAAARLGELQCPILAVAGALDVSTIVAVARHLEGTAPNARAVIMPDVAHMIGMEAPDRLSELVVDFLAPLRPWK